MFRVAEGVQDSIWETSEIHLDKKCARAMAKNDFDCFFGVEHGALDAIHAAKKSGKKSVVAFLSPHRDFRRKWVDVEYESFPELLTPSTRKLLELGDQRDQRRQEEAKAADVIHANSTLTFQSLADSGLQGKRFIPVPLGGPEPIQMSALPLKPEKPLQFIYAGPVSVRKGAHYLLEAWRLLKPRHSASLHFYGKQLLPERVIDKCGDGVVFHGSVARAELFSAYRKSCALVFPTLCDGFGEVVTEALSQGLPVITTTNAGAKDLIVDGENGFIVSPRDVETLAAKIDWCITHPTEVLEMRRRALSSASRWTWADFRKEFIRQFNDAIAE